MDRVFYLFIFGQENTSSTKSGMVMQGMMSIITESATIVVNTWKQEIEANNGGVLDIAVDSYMKRFSGDIISRACFGSNYSKGHDI